MHLAYADDEMRAATYWAPSGGKTIFDMVKSQEFQKFLKDQGFILVAWGDLAKALPAKLEIGRKLERLGLLVQLAFHVPSEAGG